MANSSANVTVAGNGAVWIAPLGTALPTSASATPNVAFKQFGYISDAGVVESQGTTTNKIKAWQNSDTVREIQTEHDLTYKFAAIEDNTTVLNAFYGNYAAGKVEINGAQPLPFEYIVDVIDGIDLIRFVLPYAQVSARGDIAYVGTAEIEYDMTITCYPDPAYAGALAAPAKAYRYDLTGGASA